MVGHGHCLELPRGGPNEVPCKVSEQLQRDDVIHSPGGSTLFGITPLEVAYLHAELSESGQVPWLGVIFTERRYDIQRLIPLRHLRVHVGRTALAHLQYRMGSQAWVRGGGIGHYVGVQV